MFNLGRVPTILSGEATAALPELSKRLWFLGMRSGPSDPSCKCFVLVVIIRKDGGMHAYVYLQIRISYMYIYIYHILFFNDCMCTVRKIVCVYLQVVPGRAGGGSFKRKKNHIAEKDFAYRMCAR